MYDLSFASVNADIARRARAIRLIVTDVDGVLTEGHVYLDQQAEAFKGFNILDGLGTKLLQRNGIQVAIITGRNSSFVQQRADALGIKYVYQGQEDKRQALTDIITRTGLGSEQLAHIGDDLPDLSLMRRVGLGIAVATAHPFVAQHAHWQTVLGGGKGAFREAADMLLWSQQKLSATLDSYLE